MQRREFLRKASLSAILAPGLAGATTASIGGSRSRSWHAPGSRFKISLAAWSVHNAFFEGRLKMIDQPAFCREVGIAGLELVNSFFPSPQYRYLRDFQRSARDNGVEILLIMCDREGDMAHLERKERMQAARNHQKWIDIAHILGCHSIRCNWGSGKPGDPEPVRRAAESFWLLSEYAATAGINVIIENHGGISSHAFDLIALMKAVNRPNFGTLPDFGNFPEGVDPYDSVRRMMPYAKAVSAKCYDFDDETGEETRIDYGRMLQIVLEAGYNSWIGIEYEGKRLSERDGILACKRLLERYQ